MGRLMAYSVLVVVCHPWAPPQTKCVMPACPLAGLMPQPPPPDPICLTPPRPPPPLLASCLLAPLRLASCLLRRVASATTCLRPGGGEEVVRVWSQGPGVGGAGGETGGGGKMTGPKS